jgi:hypothetical protein
VPLYNAYGGDPTGAGYFEGGDVVHSDVTGQYQAAQATLAGWGIGAGPFGYSGLAVNNITKPSRMAYGSSWGATGVSARYSRQIQIGRPNSIQNTVDQEMFVGRRLRIVSKNYLTGAETVMLQISSGEFSTAAYLAAIGPPNSSLLLDGTQTSIKSNVTLSGTKGIDFFDIVTNKYVLHRGIPVYPQLTVATAPNPATLNGMTCWLTDGASGTGIYISKAGAWALLFAM